ncbi:MAG: hypothetical protein K9G67_04760 [Bacteroidales bacterium]|nr:hypothetical protein [Bacteroidales bacterium]MCF8344664.1 hypothetical protein [Bacteroidales bacterium]MCF8375644.1 hypothetical protein [Bacteroidales bacterium]MCF8400773.1 hypothetical protein [Bacteroidales bacterium]
MLFNSEPLSNHLQNVMVQINESISQYKKNDYKNLGIDELREGLICKYQIDEIGIDPSSVKEPKPIMKPDNRAGKDAVFVEYSIPISGPTELFACKPKDNSEKPINGEIKDGYIIIECNTAYFNIDLPDRVRTKVRQDITQLVEKINTEIDRVNKDIKEFNESLPSYIHDKLKQRLDQIIKIEKQNKDLNPFN